ncbi:DUF6484 domain-containing protein [Cystobacter fuscus]|uniref:DUF6484 domain-containing protein n=1 Tax=Cystobacter fuscus TaxID=43 RepID=UPI002B28F1FB|nr:hypothetical protein F0U63_39950 [Cystobacter fuscus]
MSPSHKDVKATPALESDEPILGSRVGWVAGYEPARGLLVDFDGNRRSALPARSTLPLDAQAVRAAVASRQQAVLLFDAGDPSRPLLMGLLHTVSPTPLLDAFLEVPPPAQAPALSEPTEARVDGKRVVIEGKNEIVLKCGEASITLRRNGKVVIRGVQLETSATGVHRIKGGSVQIN